MKNQAQTEMPPFRGRQELAEFMLDLDGVLGRSEAQPPRQAPDVGVYRQARQIERNTANHIGGLSTYASQLREVIQVMRHFPTKLMHQLGCHTNQILGFGLIEARRTNNAFQLRNVGVGEILWCGIARKEIGRHHVHPRISALSRKDGGGQQFKRVTVRQFTFGTRILACQTTSDLNCPALW